FFNINGVEEGMSRFSHLICSQKLNFSDRSMGCCLSSAGIQSETPLSLAAKIISLNGTLRQYPIPVTVAQVLQAETEFMEPPSSSSSSSSSSSLICNSDSLYYDSYVLSLDSEHQLQANQIYFVLPSSKFQHRLTASDMAALAVKASVALQNAHGPRRNKARISPLLFVHQSITSNYEDEPSTSASAINSKTLGKLSPAAAVVKAAISSRPGCKVHLRQEIAQIHF
ncbi:HTH-type transcriptional regulator, partial [Quillaja saponaria]